MLKSFNFTCSEANSDARLLLRTAYKVIAPKRLPNPKGTANSPFDPSNNQNVLSAPQYREHLEDILQPLYFFG